MAWTYHSVVVLSCRLFSQSKFLIRQSPTSDLDLRSLVIIVRD